MSDTGFRDKQIAERVVSNSFLKEVSRLFLLPEQGYSPTVDVIGPTGKVRTLVLSVKIQHVERLTNLLWGLVEELRYPLPAIAVTPVEGFQVWISLDDPIELDHACRLLESLRSRYLGDVPDSDCVLRPSKRYPEVNRVDLPPTEVSVGRWSAFIDPTLIAMFKEDPWLEISPSTDKQRDLLARLECLSSDAISEDSSAVTNSAPAVKDAQKPSAYDFLAMVMNDTKQDMRHRIEAAKALLFHNGR